MANLLYGNQYFTTTLNVGGGINNSQTTGIIISGVSGLDITKPGIALINYAEPLVTNTCEWVEYTSINGSNELQGVTRASEGFSAKAHDNGVAVAFPLSESHINRLAAALSIGGVATNGVTTTLDEDDMATNSATALATQQSIKAYVDSIGSSTGWTASTDTWVYASASTFTIAGVDRTTTFTPGTKLKFTQTTDKYAVVASSSFSTNTTVTIAVNTDYTIANAAITSPFYSYQVNPRGYPTWFAYTPTFTGFSADPTVGSSRFRVIGRSVLVQHAESATGTSNATGFTITLPITAVTSSGAIWTGSGQVRDNGTISTAAGLLHIASGGTALTVYLSWNATVFSSSGNKQLLYGQIEYEI